MKRSAEQAFSVPAAPAFQPNGAAMFDPKAYFQQFQQAAMSAQAAPGQPAAAGASSGQVESEVQLQVRNASAVRCAAIVKEKGDNFPTAVLIEALHTMALKSSFKLREDLVKCPHVRKLCTRAQELLKKPPQGLALDRLSLTMWSLVRFPDAQRGDAAVVFAATAKLLGSLPPTQWEVETASQILWCLARTNVIAAHHLLVTQVVRELVKDRGARVAKLTHEGCVNLLFAIARARVHDHKGDHRTVHLQANDETFFDLVGKRVAEEIDQIDVKLLADIVHTHHEVGLRREPLFKAMCPKLVKNLQDLQEEKRSATIKAYTRFMIPLKEEAQGFRTMAIVAKGDFQRPSEKPKRTGKVSFDKPIALYEKTQVHQR